MQRAARVPKKTKTNALRPRQVGMKKVATTRCGEYSRLPSYSSAAAVVGMELAPEARIVDCRFEADLHVPYAWVAELVYAPVLETGI